MNSHKNIINLEMNFQPIRGKYKSSIIYNLYQGKDVFILVDDNLIDLNESLFKFIQQRYGYNACRINNLEDLIYAENTDFSREGLCNLDIDKERLSYMLETERLKSGGKPYELI